MQIIPADLQSIGGRRVSESEVVHPLRHANVVDDEVAIAGGNDLADLVLDLLEDALGGFDTGRRRGADVELDLSAVNGGEEVAADHCEHHASQREHQRGDHWDNAPSPEQHCQHPDITPAKPLKPMLEPLVKARQPVARAGCPAVVLALEQQAEFSPSGQLRRGRRSPSLFSSFAASAASRRKI
jgi:hypothetical protein